MACDGFAAAVNAIIHYIRAMTVRCNLHVWLPQGFLFAARAYDFFSLTIFFEKSQGRTP